MGLIIWVVACICICMDTTSIIHTDVVAITVNHLLSWPSLAACVSDYKGPESKLMIATILL